jgi:hypothetical protein
MYPGGIDPGQEVDPIQAEEIEERRVASSWKTWIIVMLVIAAVVLLFVVLGNPETPTDSTVTPPTLSG